TLAERALHVSCPAGRDSARPALRPDRGESVADDPRVLQSLVFQRPGSDLAPGRVLLRLYPPLLPFRLGLAPGCGHPDDAGRGRRLCLEGGLPELSVSRPGGAPSLGAGGSLCPAARGPLPARPLRAPAEPA